MERDMVLIDYGHGGVHAGSYQTAGKQYLHTSQEPPVWIGEGLVNRCIAARLMQRLRSAGVDVFDVVAGQRVDRPLTWMELEQRDTPLAMRTANANRIQNADRSAILVSIHANAMSNTSQGNGQSYGGVSIWTSRGQTESDRLADELWWGLTTYDGHGFRVNRGDFSDGDVDHEADFHLLARTYGTAVLLECGFFDHWPDAERLMSRAGQRLLAESITEGIMRYLKRARSRTEVADGV